MLAIVMPERVGPHYLVGLAMNKTNSEAPRRAMHAQIRGDNAVARDVMACSLESATQHVVAKIRENLQDRSEEGVKLSVSQGGDRTGRGVRSSYSAIKLSSVSVNRLARLCKTILDRKAPDSSVAAAWCGSASRSSRATIKPSLASCSHAAVSGSASAGASFDLGSAAAPGGSPLFLVTAYLSSPHYCTCCLSLPWIIPPKVPHTTILGPNPMALSHCRANVSTNEIVRLFPASGLKWGLNTVEVYPAESRQSTH
ncbi:hypothetical protein B0H10DRAFT_1938103 [Mycena sp. CBHHK59/15]|nr:hypothetical protein B0H10DRAFT_1938103 [Mycena sp. CBHHK59/15]